MLPNDSLKNPFESSFGRIERLKNLRVRVDRIKILCTVPLTKEAFCKDLKLWEQNKCDYCFVPNFIKKEMRMDKEEVEDMDDSELEELFTQFYDGGIGRVDAWLDYISEDEFSRIRLEKNANHTNFLVSMTGSCDCDMVIILGHGFNKEGEYNIEFSDQTIIPLKVCNKLKNDGRIPIPWFLSCTSSKILSKDYENVQYLPSPFIAYPAEVPVKESLKFLYCFLLEAKIESLFKNIWYKAVKRYEEI